MCDGCGWDIGDVDGSIAADCSGREASYSVNVSYRDLYMRKAGDMAYCGVALVTAGRRERREEAVVARASGLSVLAIEDMANIVQWSCKGPRYRKKTEEEGKSNVMVNRGRALPIGAGTRSWGGVGTSNPLSQLACDDELAKAQHQ